MLTLHRFRALACFAPIAVACMVSGCGQPDPSASSERAGDPASAISTRTSALSFQGDSRFGFLGEGARSFAQTFGSGSYVLVGNQNDPANPITVQSLSAASDPLPGERVVFRVALLNSRLDGYGQSLATFTQSLETYGERLGHYYMNIFAITEPSYSWFHPDAARLVNNERDQIVSAIRRWHQKGIKDADITFEIGNEPNYFVSMTPAEYAALFKAYYEVIKAEAPGIRVSLGAFFAFELMPADARDMVMQLITLKGQQEADLQVNVALGSTTGTVFRFLTFGVSDVVGQLWGSYAGERAARDVKNLLKRRYFTQSTKQYLSSVFDSLPPTIAPDAISFHAYPSDFKAHLSPDDIAATITTLAQDLSATAKAKRPAAYASGPAVLITEMGNINPSVNEATIANRLHIVTDTLARGTAVSGWFWYKTVGADSQFALLQAQSGVAPPLTRMVSDPTYAVPTYPAAIPCSSLNEIGQAYYAVANRRFCDPFDSFSFFTSFQPADLEPTWTGRVMQYNATSSYTIANGPNGVRALHLTGSDKSATAGGASYSYQAVYDVRIPVTSDFYLQYSVNPADALSKAVGVDLIFTDGTTLRDSGTVDQWGYDLHPGKRAANPNLTPGAWNFVSANIGARNAGKTISAIMVAYDQAPQSGTFSAWFSPIFLGSGS